MRNRNILRQIREWESSGIGANEIHHPTDDEGFTIEAGAGTDDGWDLYYPGYNSPSCDVLSTYTTDGLNDNSKAASRRIIDWVYGCWEDWKNRQN